MPSFVSKFTAASLLSAAVFSASAQELSFSVLRLGCGPPQAPSIWPYRGKVERESVTATWTDVNRLQVEAWDDEAGEDVIDDSSGKMFLQGEALDLSYAHRTRTIPPGQHHFACLFAAKLVFVVSGIERSHYEVRIEGHKAIDVAP